MSAVIIMATAPTFVSTCQALIVVNVPLDIFSYLTNRIVFTEVIFNVKNHLQISYVIDVILLVIN